MTITDYHINGSCILFVSWLAGYRDADESNTIISFSHISVIKSNYYKEVYHHIITSCHHLSGECVMNVGYDY